VACLIGHLENRRAARGGASQKTRTQRVTGKGCRIKPDAGGVRLDDAGNALVGQPRIFGHAVVAEKVQRGFFLPFGCLLRLEKCAYRAGSNTVLPD
jgi:hypothetical protein